MIGVITFSAGILLALINECLTRRDRRKQDEREKSKEHREYLQRLGEVNDNHMDHILKDYETMNREIHNRSVITEAVGAILITASFLILANTVAYKVTLNSKYSMCIISMLLYVLWFFVLHNTTKELDNMMFSRIRAIEEALSDEKKLNYDFGIHRYIRGETRNTHWIGIRRRFWVWVLLLLFSGWGLILSI